MSGLLYSLVDIIVTYQHEKTMNKHPTMEEQLAQILSIIQQGMNKKQLNTAALAQNIELERKELKRILTGQRDITMREFISISTALQLDASMLKNISQLRHKQNKSK